MRQMPPLIMSLAILLTLPLASACSQVPYPTTYEFSTQKKMQAAGHWHVLAKDIAATIATKVQKGTPLYVSKTNKVPACVFLGNFLEEELLANGFEVNVKETPGSLPVVLDAKVLEHADRYLRTPPGLLTALTSGIWVARDIALYGSEGGAIAMSIGTAAGMDLLDGAVTGPLSKQEVLISVKVLSNDQVLMSSNNLYYINSKESWHYDSSPYTASSANLVQPLETKKISISGN